MTPLPPPAPRLTAIISLALTALACPGAVRPLPPLPLDEPLGPGEVRCGKVRSASELIGGVTAYAEVGRTYRCYNNKIRFIVQDGSRPVGNSSYGGSLIDVDLVRADEASPGHDTFRELVSALGLSEIVVESVDVIDDGRDGGQAVLRVRGSPAPVSIMPAAYWLSQPVDGEVQHDFILRPDVSYVELRSEVTGGSGQRPEPLAVADFITFGRSATVLVPGSGFGEPDIFTTAPFIAAGNAEHTSYAYLCGADDLIIPLIDHDITAPICTDSFWPGERYSRYFVVGDGSVESVARTAYALRGVATGAITGAVRLPDGAPAAGVWVTALEGGGPADADAVAANQARVDQAGAYRLTLPPGSYHLVAHIEGRARSAAHEVTIAAGREVAHDLTLGAQGVLEVSTSFLGRDGVDQGPRPAKLSVAPLDGTERPSEALGELWRKGLSIYQVTADGRFSAPLPPGDYRVLVSRGFEYSLHAEEVHVAADQVRAVSVTLQHLLDTDGLVAGEFHQHTLGSVDASVPYPIKMLENAAAGVEFAASTDHDNVVDLRPYVDALGLRPFFQVVPGNEVTYQGLAHFNVYPWRLDPDDPLRDVGTRIWWKRTFPQLFTELRERAGDAVLQINHPRGFGSGYFATMGLEPSTATVLPQEAATIPTLPPTVYQDWSANFDAVEVNGSLGQPEQFTAEGWQALRALAAEDPEAVPVLADYLGLLGAGMRIGATGNSDSHQENSGVGWPRTFVRVDDDDPVAVTPEQVVEAIRAQRTAVGKGCLIELFAGSSRPMGLDEVVPRDQAGTLRVRLQAPPWITVSGLELYVNGVVQPLVFLDGAVAIDAGGALQLALDAAPATDEVVRVDAPLAGLPTGDLILLVVARGGGGLWPVDSGSPFCFSAPLYLDDGDGLLVPWLSATQRVF